MATLKPDLSGQFFNVIQEPLKAGDYFDVQYNIQNTGTAHAAPSSVNFYLSTNNIISSADRYLGNALVSDINAGSNTGTLTKRLYLPGLGDSFWNSKGNGTYTIGMFVDAGNFISESNEWNNSNTGMLDKDDLNIYAKQTTVTVNIDRVKGDFDGLWNDSDFYSRVKIDGQTSLSPTVGGKNDLSPNWQFVKSGTLGRVPITIELWDSDPGYDDHVDIDPRKGDKNLHLTYDPITGSITGDKFGTRGRQIYSRGDGSDSDQGEIWFRVNHA